MVLTHSPLYRKGSRCCYWSLFSPLYHKYVTDLLLLIILFIILGISLPPFQDHMKLITLSSRCGLLCRGLFNFLKITWNSTTFNRPAQTACFVQKHFKSLKGNMTLMPLRCDFKKIVLFIVDTSSNSLRKCLISHFGTFQLPTGQQERFVQVHFHSKTHDRMTLRVCDSVFVLLSDSKRECIERFGKQPNARIVLDDDQICTTEYSRIVPLENGEVKFIFVILLDSHVRSQMHQNYYTRYDWWRDNLCKINAVSSRPWCLWSMVGRGPRTSPTPQRCVTSPKQPTSALVSFVPAPCWAISSLRPRETPPSHAG